MATDRRRLVFPSRSIDRRSVIAGLMTVALGSVHSEAWAGASIELRYTRLQVYSGALRYLRIDLGYEITEKDADAAYLLFKYRTRERESDTFGAFEIIETKEGVRLAVKLPQMPSYHENVLRDGLVRKLREDYGEESPKPPRRKKGAPKKDDDDEDAPTEQPIPPTEGKSPVERLPQTPPGH